MIIHRRFIEVTHLADPDEITELEPVTEDGREYLVRVVFGYNDRRWGQCLTTTAKELAPHLFPEDE